MLQTLTRWAGYANFVFDQPEEGGEPGGLPGGFGLLTLHGTALQVLYVAATVISTITMVAAIVRSFSVAALRRGFSRFVAATRSLPSEMRSLASAARLSVTGAVQTLRQGIGKLSSGIREWFEFWKDLGGLTSGTWSRFRLYASTTIRNLDWTGGRIVGGIDTAVHEGFHWLMSRVPFWWAAQRVTVGGQPIGAVLNWAEETVAYTLGHASALRPHGVMVAPFEAFRSVYSNFGALGPQAVKWALGELALIGGGLATYFGFRDPESERLGGSAP